MKFSKTVGALACALAASLATQTAAQEGFNGSLKGSYISAPDDSFDAVYLLEGSGQLGNPEGLSFQLDLSLASYVYDGSAETPYTYLTLHGMHPLGNGAIGGAFVSANLDEGEFDEVLVGIESTFGTQNLEIEAFGGAYVSEGDEGYTEYGVTASFAPEGFPIDGGAFFIGYIYGADEGDYDNDNLFAGVSIPVSQGLTVELRAARMAQGSYNYYTVALEKSFGKGAQFQGRGYINNFPGY